MGAVISVSSPGNLWSRTTLLTGQPTAGAPRLSLPLNLAAIAEREWRGATASHLGDLVWAARMRKHVDRSAADMGDMDV